MPLALQLLDAADAGADRVRPAWDKVPLPAKREVIRLVFARLTIGHATGRLSRWSTEEERRLDAAGARIRHEWREPAA